MDGGQTSRSTRRINQKAAVREVAIVMRGHIYIPEFPCEDVIANQQILDRERDKITMKRRSRKTTVKTTTTTTTTTIKCKAWSS